jgi:phage baseplate assembly protein W
MAIQTSDFNANKTLSRLTKADRFIYSDLNLAFLKHPVLADITPLKDIDAVKQSVRNLVSTNFFDKPFHPEIGSRVTALLFEQADEFTGIAIRDEIKRVIKDYEPRVNAVRVEIFDDHERNRYHITIGFNVIFSNTEEEINFNLKRLR